MHNKIARLEGLVGRVGHMGNVKALKNKYTLLKSELGALKKKASRVERTKMKEYTNRMKKIENRISNLNVQSMLNKKKQPQRSRFRRVINRVRRTPQTNNDSKIINALVTFYQNILGEYDELSKLHFKRMPKNAARERKFRWETGMNGFDQRQYIHVGVNYNRTSFFKGLDRIDAKAKSVMNKILEIADHDPALYLKIILDKRLSTLTEEIFEKQMHLLDLTEKWERVSKSRTWKTQMLQHYKQFKTGLNHGIRNAEQALINQAREARIWKQIENNHPFAPKKGAREKNNRPVIQKLFQTTW